MIMSKLLILGAGQYGMVAKEIAGSMHTFDKIDFLDDNNPIAVGKLDEYEKFKTEYDSAAVAIGNSQMRLDLIQKLKAVGYILPALIHERAYVSATATISEGCLVEAMTVINTDASIGTGCIISAGAIVNHNAVVGNGCHLDCGTIVKARTVIAEKTRTDYGQIIG